jgi:hypothetical protein
MKPLYELNKIDKQNYFNLLVYGLMDKIREKANKWFDKTFINKKPYFNDELLINHLRADLDYIFSEAIWIIELGESQGFDMNTVKRFLQSDYDRYTQDEHGYRFLVENRLYDAYKNILLSDGEANEREKKMGDEISTLIQDMIEKGEFDIMKKNIE